jgi:hypothetical protein
VNAFASAMAEEVARARADLTEARSRQDDTGISDAIDRLRDLSELLERAGEGLPLAST